MRKTGLIFLLLLLFGSRVMAGSPLSEEGYAGSVSLSVTPQLGFGADVTTSHGYSFGNGLWMGGGAGVSFARAYDGVFFPIYTEAKYTFMRNKKASPFIDCRLGFMTNFRDVHMLFSPSAGVDIKRFSVFVSYNRWAGVRAVNCGAAFNF